ncbi:hypothetical protein EXE10_20950 [Acinetobacter sp. WCHAc060033]|uniref:hypothetical protein n=1 Tax=Acinetobacter sp. WCHAc060033 TaxID=2518624 RepID=UPI001023EC1F|nr:hypothetical protein [Acinetobacter sp. WCHAc060033]RZG72931.1 hypothetical protein EXE10_20950 [Acinetobacter sp. WCHAc060033]
MSILHPRVYFSQFDSNTENGARYRVGIEKPVFYILKPKAKKDFSLKGFQQTYDLYREYPNSLYKIQDSKISDWLNNTLTKAVTAKSNSDYYEILNNAGHFASADYKKWKRASRGLM